jgi:hypothetical protein
LATRVIKAGDPLAHENKALVDWLKLHGVNPDDCLKVEEKGKQVRFTLVKRRRPGTVVFDSIANRVSTRTVTCDAVITLAEAGI